MSTEKYHVINMLSVEDSKCVMKSKSFFYVRKIFHKILKQKYVVFSNGINDMTGEPGVHSIAGICS